MNTRSNFLKSLTSLFMLTMTILPLPGQSVQAQESIEFTAEQVANGEAIYKETCQICHGSRLSNGQFGTPLRGSFFKNTWKGKTLGELVQNTYEKMPPDNVMSMSMQQYTEVISFILSRNEIEPGDTAIEGHIETLNLIPLPWQ
ncbi:MAG: cytochrome c5 [Pseudohongiellaceae bacterium]|jgi:cytochrome c5